MELFFNAFITLAIATIAICILRRLLQTKEDAYPIELDDNDNEDEDV